MADFYGNAAGFQSYHTERQQIYGVFDDAEIDGALLLASEWLDAKFRDYFEGLKVGARDQVREWPRSGATDAYGYAIRSDGVPREIMSATYEIARKVLLNPTVLNVDYTPNAYKQVSVDGAVSVVFADPTSADEVQTQFRVVSQIMAGLTSKFARVTSSLSGSTVRA